MSCVSERIGSFLSRIVRWHMSRLVALPVTLKGSGFGMSASRRRAGRDDQKEPIVIDVA